jgi:Ca2+-binding RTX toxin-like protein
MERLEERQLMAADMMTNMAFVGPVPTAPAPSTTVAASSFTAVEGMFLLPAVDVGVEANWQQVGTSNYQQLVIDGSDQNDFITIESYGNYYTSGPTFTVKLDRFDGATLVSSTRVTLSMPKGFQIDPYRPLVVMGKGGADRLLNQTGMTMAAYGGFGDDTLIGGSATDYLYGESGFDNMSGGAGADYLDGGTENDVLYGNAGADTVVGGDGDDRMWGGADNDLLQGMKGRDAIFGDDGNWNYYTNFADRIFGGEGDDTLDGENGADVIYGDGGNDTILGSFGNDTLYGGIGNDFIYGEDGRDRLFGQDGVDLLSGGAMDDYLDGGYKSDPNSSINNGDYLIGGLGSDTFARHRSTIKGLGSGDPDVFADYGSGDSTDNIFHW